MFKLFKTVNTESEAYFEDTSDEVWVRNEDGELVKLEDDENESNTEGQ